MYHLILVPSFRLLAEINVQNIKIKNGKGGCRIGFRLLAEINVQNRIMEKFEVYFDISFRLLAEINVQNFMQIKDYEEQKFPSPRGD